METRKRDRASENYSGSIYKAIFENSIDAILIATPDGVIQSANPAACKMFGWTEKEIIKNGRDKLLDLSDVRISQIVAERTRTGSSKGEVNHKRKDGTIFSAEISTSLFKDAEGRDRSIIIIRDLTDKKLAEEAIAKSDEKFRLITNLTPNGVYLTDSDGNCLFVNAAWCSMAGMTPQEAYGGGWINCIYRIDRGFVLEKWKEFVSAKTKWSFEYRIINKNGNILWVYGQAKPILNEAGKVIGFLGTNTDITERKKVEEKLNVLERQSRAWLENSPVCTKIVDIDFNLQFMSSAGIKGLQIDDIAPYYGKPYPFHFYSESFKTKMTGNMIRAKETGEVITQEAPVVDINGNEVWFHSTIVPVKDQSDRVDYLLIVSIDTTDNKRDEEALRKSLDLLDTTFDSLTDALFIIDDQAVVVKCNRAASQIFGYAQEEILGQTTAFLHVNESALAEFRQHLYSAIEAEGRLHHFEFRMKRRDGTIFATEHSTIPLVNVQGRSSGWVSVVRDISERKRAEEELFASQNLYRLLAENSSDIISMINAEGKVVYISPAYTRQLGYEKDELLNIDTPTILQHIHPDDHERIGLEIKHGRELRLTTTTYEYRLKTKQGGYIWVEDVLRREFDENGNIVRVIVNSRNITDRKNAEEKQKESEEKYRLLAEQSDVGVGLYSTEGIVLYFNNRALKNLGGNLEDYVGKSQIDLFGKKAGTKYLNRIKEVIRLQKTLVFEDFFESQSGKYWFSSNHSIVRDSNGDVVGIQVVAIDITQRKNFEEQLIKSARELQELTRHMVEVREEERTSIARDLHDDLGQKLTALNMELGWLKTRIGVQSRPVESKFQQMTSLMNETIDSIQKISYGLRPSILDDLGLVPAIEWQVIDFHKSSGISCNFSCSPNDISVDAGISLVVFRIIQEALTNIARHSGATKVKIRMNLTDGVLEILVRDNGRGIDPKKIESSKSFGLMGMRERVRVVSGELSISGIMGEGTSVLVRIPVGE